MNDPLLLTIVILGLIAILFILVAFQRKETSKGRKKKIYDKLTDLKINIDSDEGSIRRDTIIKLDNLLTKAFQYRYSNNKSCGENLKAAKKLFRKDDYQRIWDVHKKRNKVVHSDEEISTSELEEAYKVYKFSINKILK